MRIDACIKIAHDSIDCEDIVGFRKMRRMQRSLHFSAFSLYLVPQTFRHVEWLAIVLTNQKCFVLNFYVETHACQSYGRWCIGQL